MIGGGRHGTEHGKAKQKQAPKDTEQRDKKKLILFRTFAVSALGK